MSLNIFSQIGQEARDLRKFRWVIQASVSSTLKLRYKRSFFGFFWSLIGPILNYGTISFVFYFGLRMKSENFLAHIMPGILIFSLFSTAIVASSSALIANENFIKKVYLPKSIFIINAIFVESINFVFNFIAVVVFLFAFASLTLSASFLLIPLVVFLFIVFITGLGILCGIAGIFFRDVMHFIPLSLQALFYGTPILYDPAIIPEKYHFIFKYNPILPFLEAFRGIIEKGEWVSPELLIQCLAYASVSFLFGVIVLKRFDNKIVFKL